MIGLDRHRALHNVATCVRFLSHHCCLPRRRFAFRDKFVVLAVLECRLQAPQQCQRLGGQGIREEVGQRQRLHYGRMLVNGLFDLTYAGQPFDEGLAVIIKADHRLDRIHRSEFILDPQKVLADLRILRQEIGQHTGDEEESDQTDQHSAAFNLLTSGKVSQAFVKAGRWPLGPLVATLGERTLELPWPQTLVGAEPVLTGPTGAFIACDA